MNTYQTGFQSIQQMQDSYLKKSFEKPNGIHSSSNQFDAILQQKELGVENKTESNAYDALKFSKHASGRLQERGISLSEEQLQRLQEGTAKAEAKGINESLVLMDRLAFIVNIPNSTVITAMSQEETSENIFTNIDGAVII